MSTQISVRLPDDLVAYVDHAIGEGKAPSRAAVVARALERDRRRAEAERDAAIYAAIKDEPDPDDLDGLAAYASRVDLSDLD